MTDAEIAEVPEDVVRARLRPVHTGPVVIAVATCFDCGRTLGSTPINPRLPALVKGQWAFLKKLTAEHLRDCSPLLETSRKKGGAR